MGLLGAFSPGVLPDLQAFVRQAEYQCQTPSYLKTMTIPTAPEAIPPLRWGQLTCYSPADIKRWGVQHFLETVAPTVPLPIPDLGFTAAENARMDDLLREERDAAARGL